VNAINQRNHRKPTSGKNRENLMPPGITFFSCPRSMEGAAGIAQRNAIESWARSGTSARVILFGDDRGVAELAKATGAIHEPDVPRNELGTPLLAHVFRRVHELAGDSVCAYVNSDIILLSDFPQAVARIVESGFDRFLMMGRRMEVTVSAPLDFCSNDWEHSLRAEIARTGVWASRVCKDYFVYPNTLYSDIPPFAVGRGNMDNWMVFHAHQHGIPVVDATRVVTAVHQRHRYGHVAGGRKGASVTGVEAVRNCELAGGRHLIRGSSATWKLTSRGLRRVLTPAILQFAADAIPFSLLLLDMFCRSNPRPNDNGSG